MGFATAPVRGSQVGYAEITSTFLKPTAGAGAEDVTLLTVTFTPMAAVVFLHFWCSHVTQDTATSTATVLITDSANTIVGSEGSIPLTNTATGSAPKFEIWTQVTPAIGTPVTYKVRINTATGGSKPSIFASSTSKAFLRAIEV